MMASFFSARQRKQSPRMAVAQRAGLVLPILLAAAVGSILIACVCGSVSLSFVELWQALLELLRGPPTTLPGSLLDLRLGRALTGFVTGATLALAGVMMQALLRNPLADPYVLGISGGASVGALAIILFFGAFWLVDVAAFAGAITVAYSIVDKCFNMFSVWRSRGAIDRVLGGRAVVAQHQILEWLRRADGRGLATQAEALACTDDAHPVERRLRRGSWRWCGCGCWCRGRRWCGCRERRVGFWPIAPAP